MRTIANLKGAEFLRAINRGRHAVEKLMKTTDVMGIWKRMPAQLPERAAETASDEEKKEAEQQRTEAVKAQIKQNLNDILDTLLDTHADAVVECVMALCVLDPGEPEPDGIELVMAAVDLVSDERVLNFFSKLKKSGLIDMES